MYQANLALATRDADEAISIWKGPSTDFPDKPVMAWNLAEAYRQKGDARSWKPPPTSTRACWKSTPTTSRLSRTCAWCC